MKRNNNAESLFVLKRRGLLTSCAFLLGFVSVVIQVVLIRELMTTFSGHELVFAVVLGVWLIGISAGSAWIRPGGPSRAGWVMAGALALFPLTVIGIRSIRPVWGIPAGSMMDMGLVMAAALVLLLPITLMLGAAFAFLTHEMEGRDVYAREALGFVAGGVVMTFVFFVPLPPVVDAVSRQALWPGYRVLAAQQSRYGSVVVAERGGQKSFFENGKHLFTENDALAAEEVHAGLLAHPAPRTMFLAGGGFSQAGHEALKHPLELLEYAELDPVLVRLEKEEIPFKDDPRLHVIARDPRAVLARSQRRYDVICFNMGDPTDLASGRFFTREFFAMASSRLAPGGVLAVTISGSENYVNAQAMAYARAVRSTLQAVFRHVEVIPGERMTFMASQEPCPVSPVVLVERLEQRRISVQFMRGYYLRDRMSARRMSEAHAWLLSPGEVGTQARPIVSFRAFILAMTRASSGFSRIVEWLADRLWVLGCLVLLVLASGLFRKKRIVALTGAAVAGSTQMLFQVMTIFWVQSIFGHAYAAIGLLTAGFMLGAFYGVRYAERLKPQAWAWVQVVLALSFVSLVMPWPSAAFFFPILAGLAGGAQFVVYAGLGGRGCAGKIYAADVAGAAIGAFLGGGLLVPFGGMVMAAVFIAALNAAMALALYLQPGSVSAER